MSNFKSSVVLARLLISRTIQLFTTDEGADFDIMALTDEQKELVESCDTYDEMVEEAANYGLSFNGKRAVDNQDIADMLELFWSDEDLPDCEPSSKAQVGVRVCEISGLLDVLKAQKEQEEKELIIDADSVTQEQLAADAEEFINTQAIA